MLLSPMITVTSYILIFLVYLIIFLIWIFFHRWLSYDYYSNKYFSVQFLLRYIYLGGTMFLYLWGLSPKTKNWESLTRGPCAFSFREKKMFRSGWSHDFHLLSVISFSLKNDKRTIDLFFNGISRHINVNGDLIHGTSKGTYLSHSTLSQVPIFNLDS